LVGRQLALGVKRWYDFLVQEIIYLVWRSSMPITLVPIKASGKTRVPMEDISADTIEAVDAAYVFCETSAERLEGAFGTKDAAEAFLHEARSYAYKHEPRYVVTGNSTSGGTARFRVELYVKGEKDTDTSGA
jgi:hypothetical protein